MKTKTISIFAALFSMCAANANAGPVLRAETQHLVVYSSYNEDVTTSYASQLEKLRYVLDAYYGDHDSATSEQKLPIYLLDVLNYPLLIERARATQFVGAFNLTACASGISVRSTLNRDLVKVTGPIEKPTIVPSYLPPLNSGYSRLFIANSSDMPYPRWFDSGFAAYYSTTLTDGNRVVMGMMPSTVGGLGALRRFGEYLTNDSWPDFKDIVTDGSNILSQQQKSRGIGLINVNSSDGGTQITNNGLYHAKSWALTYYVLSQPDNMQKLYDYFHLVENGEAAPNAFLKTYGVAVTTLGRTYFKDKPTSDNIVFKDMAEPVVTISRMPDSAERLLYLDAAVYSCPAQSEKDNILAAVLREAAKYPGDPYSQRVAASAQVILGQEAQALPALRALVAADPTDAEANMRLGQALYLMAVDGKTEAGVDTATQIEAARNALMRAYKLQAGNAETLYYLSLALTRSANSSTALALNAAIEAARLQPTVPQYAANAAGLLLASGQRDQARSILSPVANGPNTFNNDDAKTLSYSEWGRAVIKSIDSGETPEKLSTMLKNIPEN